MSSCTNIISAPKNKVPTGWDMLVENGKIKIFPPSSKFSIEKVHEFQQQYILALNKERFLRGYNNKPDYNA